MAQPAAINFGLAYKALQKAADAHPEWFDRARDVLKRTEDGHVLLLHAVLEGLQEAYEAGQRGRGLPPLRFVQSIANAPAAPSPKRIMRGAK